MGLLRKVVNKRCDFHHGLKNNTLARSLPKGFQKKDL